MTFVSKSRLSSGSADPRAERPIVRQVDRRVSQAYRRTCGALGALGMGLVLLVMSLPVAAQSPDLVAPSPDDLVQRLRRLEEAQDRFTDYLQATDTQTAPGAADPSPGEIIPSAVYSPEYYERIFGGARPVAEYAPPGFQPRDQQEGPGVPEYSRLTVPRELTPEEREKFATRGVYPGSVLVPGTSTSFRFRGFARLAGLFDFDPVGVSDAFVTNSIPVPQRRGQNFNMSGRISRFAVETWTPSVVNDWTVHTYIEGDFFNGLPQAAGGGGNPFRLRHAFADIGFFRFGQQNTVFMDPSSWPSLVDFQGPNSWVNQRQPSARITLPLLEWLYWAASVERPFSDISTHDLGEQVQDVPDFATHLRFQGARGDHLQIAGLVRTIGYRPDGDDVTRRTGGGISGSTVLHPWAILSGTDPIREENPSKWTRSRLILQGTWGVGIGRFLNDLPGQRVDGQVDPLTGEFDLVEARGWNASYEQWFHPRWLANVTYANVSVSNRANQQGTSFDETQYLATSVWWLPSPRASVGLEYMWGERVNLDGNRGRAERLHGLFQYNF